ncbi:MAG TPA: 2Fe-2S iron-sulfur cluster-binding protein [Acidimicrobiales bacterium]|nr:2Fe-2S iron-sulfur cluster-binding protein [Acidimicrobiales bacterium]
MQFSLNGTQVDLDDEGASLLDLLRERLGIRSAKDGCSPQGQCGCCTVLVDGSPRVACVTPARRVAGREVTTLEGLDPSTRDRWAEALLATGGSQCGFCTPGIVLRLAATATANVDTALLAHLCRCTGWQAIVEAVAPTATPVGGRDLHAAAERSALEGGVPQRVGSDVVLGAGGFAEDTAPPDALVAVPTPDGGWAVAETLHEARRAAGKVQGRRTTRPPVHPLELPPGDWDLTLRTTWIEPAALEPDASWCAPGGEPWSPLANGGAFGAKVDSDAPATARRLADEHGRPVRVVLSREDTVRLGPKRPPIAAGINADGTGIVRVVRTPRIADAIRSVAPGLVVEEVDVPGPPTSARLRAAGWAEAAILLAAVDRRTAITAPNGSQATATVDPATGAVHVRVRAGRPLDETVLRSYAIGAVHMALGWVTSEGLFVDETGEVHDLTIRSFGILRAKDMPPVTVDIDTTDDREPMNGSDAVFAAVAVAAWLGRGLPSEWPTERGTFT